jgi:hypothetical protein
MSNKRKSVEGERGQQHAVVSVMGKREAENTGDEGRKLATYYTHPGREVLASIRNNYFTDLFSKHPNQRRGGRMRKGSKRRQYSRKGGRTMKKRGSRRRKSKF